MPTDEMGVIGLGTIGGGLARNLASRGFHVAVYNRTHRRTEEFIAEHGREGKFTAAATLEELASLARLRGRTLTTPMATASGPEPAALINKPGSKSPLG